MFRLNGWSFHAAPSKKWSDPSVLIKICVFKQKIKRIFLIFPDVAKAKSNALHLWALFDLKSGAHAFADIFGAASEPEFFHQEGILTVQRKRKREMVKEAIT